MKTNDINQKEVLDLCNKPEGHFYDRKSKAVDGKKIQKIAVALANADGGDFIIGVKDNKEESDPKKRWDGAQDQEFFNKVFQNLLEIKPTIQYVATFLNSPYHKSICLLITVEKSDKVHHTADGTVYERVSAQSLPIKDTRRIQELSFAKGESSYEEIVYKEAKAEDIFESQELSRFLSDISPASDPVDFTVNQNLVDRKTYEPKVSGLLLFNDNPVVLLPRKCGIKITRYDTNERTPEREHLKEQVSIEGALYQQIQKAAQKIEEMMSNVNIWTVNGLQAVKYPPETIWEILVNAVIHRDYSISDDIQIHIYNNRIEIISPGKLPGYVTEDNILDARYSRNSRIVRTLNRYKNPPNKDMGEGLNTAFQKMEEFKLKKPQIKVEGNYVKVIISHTPIASADEAVLEFLKNNSQIKNKQAREITSIKSENIMKGVFYRLKKKGLIEPILSSTGNRAIAWKLNEKKNEE